MDYDREIRDILRQLGIGQSYRGYEYVVYGIQLTLQDKSRLEFITKSLYPDIAKKYNTSWKCVERDIRTVINHAWKYGDEDFLFAICGGDISEKPQNTRFFELICEYVEHLHAFLLETAATEAEESPCAVSPDPAALCSGNFCPYVRYPCPKLVELHIRLSQKKDDESKE